MSVWMEVKRALTVMDLVTRSWARELKLDECGVMVLALLGDDGPLPEWSLAAKCGRSRPQVHRALRVLEDRLYARSLIHEGRTQGWALTDRGRELWRCLDRGVRQFEAELEGRMELPALRAELERIVAIFLNRPRAKGGWRNGLFVPTDLITMPIGAAASREGLVEAPSEVPAAEAGEEPELRPPPGHWPKPWTAEERQFFKLYWANREAEEDAGKQEARVCNDSEPCP